MSEKTKGQTTSPRPFLTIGIASYNYAQYLSSAIKQIKRQNFSDFEILYCDDGSGDGSQQIISGFIRENPHMRIRLVTGINKGILYNRNRILDEARGKYLMICDADDYMLDGCLEALCAAAKSYDADCVIGGFQEVDSTGRKLKKHVPSVNSCKWLYTWHHAQIYKTELFRKYSIRFKELPDDVFFLQLIHLYSRKTVFVPSVLYAWVRHDRSVSRDFTLHPDWMPFNIWMKLSTFTASLAASLSQETDKQALFYYLYKWFYFNISDLQFLPCAERKENIEMMRKQMLLIIPQYRKLSFFRCALRTQDTFFAHLAVTSCWFLEGIGMLQLIVMLRNGQSRVRKWREIHGKA